MNAPISKWQSRIATPARDRRRLLVALLLTGAVFFAFGALLDARGIRTHDYFWPYLRVHLIAAEFAAGRLPQVLPEAVYGGGYAYPLFYPPLPHWVAAATTIVTGNAMLGVNIAYFLSVLLSGLAMYWMGLVLTGRTAPAAAGALAYVAFPYRFIDIFVRGALSESWTFVWYPLIVGGLWIAARERRMPWHLPITIAGLLLTYPSMAFYFLAACAAVGVLLLVFHGARALLPLAAPVPIALGLVAFYLVPQQYYFPTIHASDPDLVWAGVDHVHAHRPTLAQLFNPVIRNWWGLSYPIGTPDGMTFYLGEAQLLALPLAAVLALRFLSSKKRQPLPALGVLLAALWLATIAFMIYPAPLLRMLPAWFAYIQFPWRLLGLAGFLAAAVILISVAEAVTRGAWRAAIVTACAAFLLLIPREQRSPSPVRLSADAITLDYLREHGGTGYQVLGELLPREIDLRPTPESVLTEPTFDGDGTIREWRRSGTDIDLWVDAGSPGVLGLPLVAYDVYRVTSGSEELPTLSRAGMLAVALPTGTHQLSVRQRLPTATRLGIGISVLTLVSLFSWQLRSQRRRRAEAPFVWAPLRESSGDSPLRGAKPALS